MKCTTHQRTLGLSNEGYDSAEDSTAEQASFVLYCLRRNWRSRAFGIAYKLKGERLCSERTARIIPAKGSSPLLIQRGKSSH